MYLVRTIIPQDQQTIIFTATRHHTDLIHSIMQVCTYVCIYVCIYVGMSQWIDNRAVAKYVCIYLWMRPKCLYVCAYISCMHEWIIGHYVCMYVCMYVYSKSSTYFPLLFYNKLYLHTYIHIHIYIYIHIRLRNFQRLGITSTVVYGTMDQDARSANLKWVCLILILFLTSSLWTYVCIYACVYVFTVYVLCVCMRNSLTSTRNVAVFVCSCVRISVFCIYFFMNLCVCMGRSFRNGESSFMIVTDLAARGIDIPLLNNVINFHFPPSPKLFVHRCGRAARQVRVRVG